MNSFKDSLPFIRAKLFAVFSIMLFILFTNEGKAQFENKLYISGGLSTSTFMGDNLAVDPLVQRDTTLPGWFGGGFNSPNAGPGIILTMSLDDAEKFRIPIGLFYHGLVSGQKVPFTRDSIFYLSHTVDFTSLSIGLNYYFVNFTNASAQAFIGLQARGNFITNQKFKLRVKDRRGKEIQTSIISPKGDAFRGGAALLLGADGLLYDKWYIHFFGGLGIVNLFGRNNDRGELLNTVNDPPRDEHFVWSFNVALMIKYGL